MMITWINTIVQKINVAIATSLDEIDFQSKLCKGSMVSHTPKMRLCNVLFLSMRTTQQNGVLHEASWLRCAEKS